MQGHAIRSDERATNFIKLPEFRGMKWRGVEWKQLRAEIINKFIGILKYVAGSREKRGFVSAGLTNEEITREFFWSNDRVGRQFSCAGSVTSGANVEQEKSVNARARSPARKDAGAPQQKKSPAL